MKVNGKYIKHLFNNKHQAELTFLIENYRHTTYLDELDEVEYTLDIKLAKSKRSIQSNKFLWAMLHQLEKETRELAIDWYVKALVDTGAVADYVWAMEKTEDSLRKQFRAVIRVKPHKIGDSNGWLYRVIVGSSKFNVKEMNKLIDTVLRYCEEENIDTEVLA
jgi:hypothetical protein